MKKFTALLLTALLLVGTITGCGSKETVAGEGGSSSALKKVTLNEVAHSMLYPYKSNSLIIIKYRITSNLIFLFLHL